MRVRETSKNVIKKLRFLVFAQDELSESRFSYIAQSTLLYDSRRFCDLWCLLMAKRRKVKKTFHMESHITVSQRKLINFLERIVGLGISISAFVC